MKANRVIIKADVTLGETQVNTKDVFEIFQTCNAFKFRVTQNNRILYTGDQMNAEKIFDKKVNDMIESTRKAVAEVCGNYEVRFECR